MEQYASALSHAKFLVIIPPIALSNPAEISNSRFLGAMYPLFWGGGGVDGSISVDRVSSQPTGSILLGGKWSHVEISIWSGVCRVSMVPSTLSVISRI